MTAPESIAVPQVTFWQRYGNAAQIASAVIAVAALLGIYLQVHWSQKLSRESMAREIYRAYLQLAVEHPELAYPANFRAGADMTQEQKARYGWFVSYLLYTCEQILENFPDDAQWRHACLEQIGYHKAYLCSSVVNTAEINDYDETVRELIRQVVPSGSADACKAA